MIGNMFIGDEEKRRLLSLDDSILIVFYEAIHLNRNFISTLTHAATDCSQITSSFTELSVENNSQINENSDNIRVLNPLSLSSYNSTPENNQNTPNPGLAAVENPPENLMVTFLQACSAILHQTKLESSNIYDTTKLFMLILQCISEDQYANSLLHDPNLVFSVYLYKAVTRDKLKFEMKLNFFKEIKTQKNSNGKSSSKSKLSLFYFGFNDRVYSKSFDEKFSF